MYLIGLTWHVQENRRITHKILRSLNHFQHNLFLFYRIYLTRNFLPNSLSLFHYRLKSLSASILWLFRYIRWHNIQFLLDLIFHVVAHAVSNDLVISSERPINEYKISIMFLDFSPHKIRFFPPSRFHFLIIFIIIGFCTHI